MDVRPRAPREVGGPQSGSRARPHRSLGRPTARSESTTPVNWTEPSCHRRPGSTCSTRHARLGRRRVIDYDRAAGEDELGYIVRRPGRDDASILERDLDARCFAPTVDPTDVLATGGIESQFFADQRLAALRAIAETRSATAGSEGLLSASVMLLHTKSRWCGGCCRIRCSATCSPMRSG